MYQVCIHVLDDVCRKFNVSKNRDTFYLSTSDEVCSLIQSLPKGYFVSLVQFDFDSVDSILSIYGSSDL